jgi:hypothetical protein
MRSFSRHFKASICAAFAFACTGLRQGIKAAPLVQIQEKRLDRTKIN